MSLLPPPGGGSDVQFKDTLMILCTVVATVYYNLYNDRCYFHDLNGEGCEICIQWNLCIMDTLGPAKSVQIIKVS